MSDPTPPGGYDPSGQSLPPAGGQPPQPPIDPDATVANPIVPPAAGQPGAPGQQPVGQPGQPGAYGQQPGQAGAYGQPGQPGAQDPTAYGYAQGSPYGDVPPPADDGKRKGLVIAVVGLGIAVAILLAGLLWALLRKTDEVATTATTAKVTSTTTSSTSTTSTTAPTTSTTTGGDNGGGGGNNGGGGNGGGGGNNGGGGGGGGQPSTTKAPTTTSTAPAPQVTSVNAPSTWTCGGGPYSPPNSQLTLSWNTSNAQSVTVAIDSPGGTFQSGLPANGSLQVPAPCAKGETQTYYVTAIGAGGAKSTKSTTTTGTGA